MKCWHAATLTIFTVASAASAIAGEPSYSATSSSTTIRPVFQRIALNDEQPLDLSLDISPPNRTLQFAEWRYGSPSSTRVAVVVAKHETDDLHQTDVQCFVDKNRDRKIEFAEQIAGAGTQPEFSLDTEWSNGDASEFANRTVRLKLSENHVEVATLGYFQQDVSLGDRTVSVRIVDGNANGLWADSQDRIWLDLDGDQKWNAFREQFPVRPFLTLSEVRYAVHLSPIGSRPLKLIENSEVGQVQLILPCLETSANPKLRQLEVMLVGDDGSAFTLSGLAETTLPSGRYRVSSVMASLQDSQDLEPLNFVFAGAGVKGTRQFHVRPGSLAKIDVMGQLRFELEVRREANTELGQDTLWVDPKLYTEDNLLITTCWRGTSDRGSANVYSNPARISVVNNGSTIASAQSGFA